MSGAGGDSVNKRRKTLTVAPPRTMVAVALEFTLSPPREITRAEAKEILVKLAIELTDASKIDAYADSLFECKPVQLPGLRRVK